MTRRNAADYTVDLEAGTALFNDAEFKALQRLEKDGLSVAPDRPIQNDGAYFDGRIPPNLSNMSPTEIGEYHNLMVEWLAYVSGRAHLAKATLDNIKRRVTLVKAKVRKSKTGAAQDKADATELDSRYVEALAALIEAETYFKLVTANEEAAKKRTAFCSRVIETKRMELEHGTRVHNVGAPRKGAFTGRGRGRRKARPS